MDRAWVIMIEALLYHPVAQGRKEQAMELYLASSEWPKSSLESGVDAMDRRHCLEVPMCSRHGLLGCRAHGTDRPIGGNLVNPGC